MTFSITRYSAGHWLPAYCSQKVINSLHLTELQRDQLLGWSPVQYRNSIIRRVK